MAFIEIEDLYTIIYQEQIEAISREDPAIPNFAIGAAIEEAKGYLEPRYNSTEIFSKTGTNRSKVVLLMVKDMAVYHMICLSNPGVDFEKMKARYERAERYFRQLQKGEINPPDLPRNEEDSGGGTILMNSNDKRNNHY